MPVAYGTRNPRMHDSPNSRQTLSLRVAGQLARPLGREKVRWGVGTRAKGHTMATGMVGSSPFGVLCNGEEEVGPWAVI